MSKKFLSKDVVVQCENCNKSHTLDKELFDFISSSEGKGQIKYEAVVNYDCDCNNSMEVTLEVYEYPENVLNFIEDPVCENCTPITIKFNEDVFSDYHRELEEEEYRQEQAHIEEESKRFE